jgi:uncharacterized protein
MKTELWPSEEEITAFCRKWGIHEMAVCESEPRPDFSSDSDVDFLISFHEGQRPPWPMILEMQNELSTLVARPVDVLEKINLERSNSYFKSKQILQSAQVIYIE